jgi:hypothetical protein
MKNFVALGRVSNWLLITTHFLCPAVSPCQPHRPSRPQGGWDLLCQFFFGLGYLKRSHAGNDLVGKGVRESAGIDR